MPTDRMRVTRGARAGGRIGARLHLHVSPLDADDAVDVDGALVTSKARTVIDTAVSLPFGQAVVVADGALADPLVGPALVAAMERAAGRTGIERARRAVSVGEVSSSSTGGRFRLARSAHRRRVRRPWTRSDLRNLDPVAARLRRTCARGSRA